MREGCRFGQRASLSPTSASPTKSGCGERGSPLPFGGPHPCARDPGGAQSLHLGSPSGLKGQGARKLGTWRHLVARQSSCAPAQGLPPFLTPFIFQTEMGRATSPTFLPRKLRRLPGAVGGTPHPAPRKSPVRSHWHRAGPSLSPQTQTGAAGSDLSRTPPWVLSPPRAQTRPSLGGGGGVRVQASFPSVPSRSSHTTAWRGLRARGVKCILGATTATKKK